MKAAAAKDAVGLVRRLARLRGLTPLDRAMELCSSGAAAPGSVAHIVLNWGAPWKRQTHEVRARAVVLMRISLFIKRGKAAYEADGVYLEFANPAAVADVFEDCVIPHAAAAASWP